MDNLAWAPPSYRPEDAKIVIENAVNLVGHEELLLSAMNPRIDEPVRFKLDNNSQKEIEDPPAAAADGQNRLILAKDGRTTGTTISYSSKALGCYEAVVKWQMCPVNPALRRRAK